MTLAGESTMLQQVEEAIHNNQQKAKTNLAWLEKQMHPYFFLSMRQEPEAISILATILDSLASNKRRILADTEDKLILARLNQPGSLYDSLSTLREKDISFAHITQSYAKIPGLDQMLEIQRFEFDRKSHQEIANGLKQPINIPMSLEEAIATSVKQIYPDFDFSQFDSLLNILWLNNPSYVENSTTKRVAQILNLYEQLRSNGGIYLDVEEAEGHDGVPEMRILFGVNNPPQRDFLLQIMEVFKRLGIGIKRTYCLTLSNGIHPVFLGTFYVRQKDVDLSSDTSKQFIALRKELYNTQLLQTRSQAYQDFVTNKILCGEDASLINAFIAFCHTNLAHSSDRYDFEGVERAFYSHPDLCLQFIALFRQRFDPAISTQERQYDMLMAQLVKTVDNYNTGHKRVDSYRRKIFRCCLSFIRHTLKTNFFVVTKQALAFRLDPAYLQELDTCFTEDLPPDAPFRITFFFGRYGVGYHMGYSDIARGGWRTLIANDRDDYVTCANTMFKETAVLAHTQHLKNKDIFEGGSKMVAVLNAFSARDPQLVQQRLYKLQYSFISAFLDIFVWQNGQIKDPQIVDYYGDEEAIELGPDENMHDIMIETIARESQRRGYVLGIGLISGKQVGINHKEFGVTSAGVVTFAEETLEQLGIDHRQAPFSVKLTGGPAGDVAGNAMRLLLAKCPQVKIKLVLDGSGALFAAQGAQRQELSRLLLKQDIDQFDPACLAEGDFILYRNQRRKEGLKELYRKVSCQNGELHEEWLSVDEFYSQFNSLPFTVEADLFIPGGGRPETIDMDNWHKFFGPAGKPSARAIVEGANSFITPAARNELQKKGIVLLRDSSANKCGVISSSYEIIANLIMSQDEFIAHKQDYVDDVLNILQQRARDEVRLIFKRHQEAEGRLLFTQISEDISHEINDLYQQLFSYFCTNPQASEEPLFKQAILAHLPHFLQTNSDYHSRIDQLPAKYRYAILAVELATSMVYHGNKENDFIFLLKGHLSRRYHQAA